MRDRNISAHDLAAELKVDEEKFRDLLNGEGSPSLTLLKNIAKFFNRGLLFFIAKGHVNETKLRSAGFRTLANEYPQIDPAIKSLMERVERQRQIFMSLREELGEVETETFSPPKIPLDDLKQAAGITRKWLSLNGDRSFDAYRQALESKGVLVFRSNGFTGAWRVPTESNIEGFSIYHKEFPIIFVRKQDAKQRQLFTLAHELGHIILHRNGSIDSEENLYAAKGMERDVNAFAGFLLVPDDVLKGIDSTEKPNSPQQFEQWLREPAKASGVSVEVILRRLLDTNRLTGAEYRTYRDWKKDEIRPEAGMAVRKFRYREPVNVFGRSYVGTVLEALGARQISTTKASRFLDNIKIQDVHRLQREFNAL